MATVKTSRAIAEINLRAIEQNVTVLKARAGVPVMVVVKADGYGHGAVPVALAALNAGADWLGVAYLDEAFELRAAGVPGRVLAWLLSADDDLAAALDQDIDLSVSSTEQLAAIVEIAKQRGIRVRVHIEVDTGMARAGVPVSKWREVFEFAAAAAESLELISIWSHLACADQPTHSANADQYLNYERALVAADQAGLSGFFRHLSNSAGTLAHPELKYDLVRCGIAVYGVTPGGDLPPASEYGLSPVMTLKSQIAQVRRLKAGDGVSYSHRWIASEPTTVGLIPLGYADGLPRAATNRGTVEYCGKIFPIVGTVCMDQCVVDFGDFPVVAGEEVVVFGAAQTSAHAWAEQTATIGYELVTRIGPRVQRIYVDSGR